VPVCRPVICGELEKVDTSDSDAGLLRHFQSVSFLIFFRLKVFWRVKEGMLQKNRNFAASFLKKYNLTNFILYLLS
jgi:hypothetical protein